VTIKSLDGQALPGQEPERVGRPPEFFREFTVLPEGTSEVSLLFSLTSNGRVMPYIPPGHYSAEVTRLRAIQFANRARVPELLAEGVLRPDEVEDYVRTRGLSQAQVRLVDRADLRGLRPGEFFVGKPVQVVIPVGLTATQIKQTVLRLMEDIEIALEGT